MGVREKMTLEDLVLLAFLRFYKGGCIRGEVSRTDKKC